MRSGGLVQTLAAGTPLLADLRLCRSPGSASPEWEIAPARQQYILEAGFCPINVPV